MIQHLSKIIERKEHTYVMYPHCLVSNNNYITKYSSTWYIGMTMVSPHYICIFIYLENLSFTFLICDDMYVYSRSHTYNPVCA